MVKSSKQYQKSHTLATKAFALRAKAAAMWEQAMSLDAAGATMVRTKFLTKSTKKQAQKAAKEAQESETESSEEMEAEEEEEEEVEEEEEEEEVEEEEEEEEVEEEVEEEGTDDEDDDEKEAPASRDVDAVPAHLRDMWMQEQAGAAKPKAPTSKVESNVEPGPFDAAEQDTRTVHLRTTRGLKLDMHGVQRAFGRDAIHLRLVKKAGVFAGSAFVVFNCKEAAQAAAAQGTVKIGGKDCQLRMSNSDVNELQRRNERSIKLDNCHPQMDESHVRDVFPEAESIKLVQRNTGFTGVAFVRFKTVQEAELVVARKSVRICGRPVTLESGRRDRW